MDPLVIHVVGARPNFMKAAPVITALRAQAVRQELVHTGQHYDDAMSSIFFRDLNLPAPDRNLNVGSGSHAAQTAAIMLAFEPVVLESRPALVVVYGDVNSTIATALVSAKLHVPVAHVEAGLRSFDNSMPEEINRRVTDLLSDLLFVTAPEGLANLRAEGIEGECVQFVGNPMIDTLLANMDRFVPDVAMAEAGIDAPYAVATIHRPSNVDEPLAARRVASMLMGLAAVLPVVIPLHPRGRSSLEAAGLHDGPRLRVVEPLGYVAFMSLVRGATLVVTDSGGLQEETAILGVPCLTVRRNTERPITITHGTNRLVDPEDVVRAARIALRDGSGSPAPAPPLWDGHAGERIGTTIASWLGGRSLRVESNF